MDAGNLAPNLAKFVSFLVSLDRAIDKRDALAKVPAGLLCRVDILQLDERGLRLLGALATLVAEVAGLDVEARHKIRMDG